MDTLKNKYPINTFSEETQKEIIELFKNHLKKNIGMMRQWLNEERITDPKKMVDNKDLEYWLFLK